MSGGKDISRISACIRSMGNGEQDSVDAGAARTQWRDERTTFQRVYDVMSGLREYAQVSDIAAHADCSTDGARDALKQLTEMGVVETRGSRPAEYRRNDAYFRWKRIETLAGEHTPEELSAKIDALVTEDASLQDRFNSPDPDAVSPAVFENDPHDEVHETLTTIARWRTVRDDLTVLRRAAYREAQHRDDADAGVSA